MTKLDDRIDRILRLVDETKGHADRYITLTDSIIRDLQAENKRLCEGLEEISLWDQKAAQDEPYGWAGWEIIDMARAALKPQRSPKGDGDG